MEYPSLDSLCGVNNVRQEETIHPTQNTKDAIQQLTATMPNTATI